MQLNIMPCMPMLGAKAESDFSNAHMQQEAEQAERAMKEAAAALKVGDRLVWCHAIFKCKPVLGAQAASASFDESKSVMRCGHGAKRQQGHAPCWVLRLSLTSAMHTRSRRQSKRSAR
jgi:hypothetical protein